MARRILISIVVTALFGLHAIAQQSPELRNVRIADGGDYSLPEILRQTPLNLPGGLAVAGDLDVEVVIGVPGQAVHARVAKSPDPSGVIDRASLEALPQWLFKPSTNSGRPLTSLVLIRFTFATVEPRLSTRLMTVERKPGPEEWSPPAGSEQPVVNTMRGTPAGFQNPTIIRQVNPSYTRDAMRAKIQGKVTIDITIAPDGTVGAAKIRQSLDPALGLDTSALIAARYWLFKPATRNGVPVAANVMLELEFRLH